MNGGGGGGVEDMVEIVEWIVVVVEWLSTHGPRSTYALVVQVVLRTWW